MSDYDEGCKKADDVLFAEGCPPVFMDAVAAFLAEQPEHRWCDTHRWPCALISHSCPQGVYTDDCHLVAARIVVTP